MARMPGAAWRPLAADWASQPKIRSADIICLHTMVGSLAGTDSMFHQNGFGGTESHFGTGADGTIYQWQDTAYQADANYAGNYRVISIENADFGGVFGQWDTNDGNAVPAFTAEQIEAIAQIIAWACAEHNIPCELVPDSKPGRRGIAYHRQGVLGYMVAGGEQWSTSRGKVCPGQRRINQIPQIIARAKEILAGNGTAPQEEDMARFITADAKSPWFITDGFTRRLIPTGAVADALLKAGVVAPQKDGSKVAVVGKAVIDSIPLAR